MTDNPADTELGGKKSPRQELREGIRQLDGVPTDDKYGKDFVILTTDRQILHLIDEYAENLLDEADKSVNGALYVGLGREKTIEDISRRAGIGGDRDG